MKKAKRKQIEEENAKSHLNVFEQRFGVCKTRSMA